MVNIAEALQKNNAVLKEDRSLYIFCHFIFSRFDFYKPTNTSPGVLSVNYLPSLDESKSASPIVKATEAYFLLERANVNMRHAIKLSKGGKEGYDEYINNAKSFYNQTLALANEFFGDHELTCHVHQLLGDLYLDLLYDKKAMICYTDSIILRKTLELYFSQPFALFLKKCGKCLSRLHFDAAVATLKKARDIAGKQTHCRAIFNYESAKMAALLPKSLGIC